MKVAPKASRNVVGVFYQDSDGAQRLKIMVTAVAEDGKATQAVIKLLSKYLKVPKSAIEVAVGLSDRRKTLLVKGERSRLEGILTQLYAERTSS